MFFGNKEKKRLNKLKKLIEKSGLFDQNYYLLNNDDFRWSSTTTPLDHYLQTGMKEHRKPSKDFEPLWYLEAYPDVRANGMDALEHFVKYGQAEGRFMNAREKASYDALKNANVFDAAFYKNSYDDLKKQKEGFDYLLHYVRYGQAEGRRAVPSGTETVTYQDTDFSVERSVSEVFDTEFYLNSNPDVKGSGIDPLRHYASYGWKEGRRPNEWFDPSYYLNSYPDVAFSGQEPLQHFCKYGWKEDRNPSALFSTAYYKEKYPDVAAAGINPVLHWWQHGRNEGRLINCKEIDGHEKEEENSPSIIFVSHEASQTGAPAVLLSLMRWLKEHTHINFSIIVGAQGPWNSRFEALAPTYYMDVPRADPLSELKHFCGNHVQAVYVNTIASAMYAEQLRFLHAPYITHVHEMENVFKIFAPHVEVLKEICTKYIMVSQGSIEAMERRFDMEQIELRFLKPFIDAKRPAEIPIEKPVNKKVVFGCGAVEKRKGFDIFCGVAAALKKRGRTDFQMYWIGSDDNKDLRASEVIAQHGVGDVVEFLGSKPYPRDYFSWGDIFLLPSREDPYPLVCMEAAECDMPVVCFDERAGGMHSFVEEDAGRVVPYLDTEAMADAVEGFLEDEAQREAMGRSAHQKVVERHYVDVIAPQILAFLPKTVYINATSKDPFETYRQLIDQVRVVSFDIFDTLVTRQLADPNVVFDVIEYRHTQSESAALPLFRERMETAGKVLSSYKGKVDDISIDEIYENMSFYRNSELEKKTEIEMCVSHPLGRRIYDYARQQGKTICITSDMYLDRATIEAILRKNGIDGWNEFYLSSQRGKKKDTGRLFKQLIHDMANRGAKPDEILHIGDNWIGDVKWAKAAGLHAVRFTPLYEVEHKLVELNDEQKASLSQIGRIWESYSTQAARLWRERHPEQAADFFVRLGFELSGPLSAMMAMHTKALAEASDIKKIVFMARDGRIIKKAFDRLYRRQIDEGTFESHYLHLSRATVIPATFEHPLSSNDIYFLIEGLQLAQKPVRYFLEKANLFVSDRQVQKCVKKYFKSSAEIPRWRDLSKMAAMFAELSEQIHEANAENRKALETYLNDVGFFDEDKTLVVDVGWLLNIQSRLHNFAKKLGKQTKIVGSYVGSRDRINKSMFHESLLFDSGDPAEQSRYLEEHVTLFELLFSSPEPSAKALEQEGDGVSIAFKPLERPVPSEEFLVAQKLHFGAEAYLDEFARARGEFFPEQISKDYFFTLFKALAESNNDLVKAKLNNLEIRLGGHHEFVSYQQLIRDGSHVEYRLKKHDEYFEPIAFHTEDEDHAPHITIVTSAGLDNGSTRYRAIHLADALRNAGISSTLIHSTTPLKVAKAIIAASNTIVFQRCFEAQGNVGAFLKMAKEGGVKCLAEMDDLVFPDFIPAIGSVKGGEWGLNEAMFVATSYEQLVRQADGCIVSTPPLKAYIEERYKLPAAVFRNKVTSKRLIEPKPVDPDNVKLIYASGTYSHKEDFEIIEAELYGFMVAHPNITLSVLGAAQVSERILALTNVSNYPYMHYTAMLDFIAKHDLMLVPLADDEFNRAKSSVKFVECGAVGVPVLASKVGEFDYAIQHQQNGLLASSAEEFRALLEQVASNPKMIDKLAQNANETIKQTYTTAQIENGVVEMVKGN